METPLLATKLFVPEERPGLVARPRLVERLQDTLHHSLALVSAPAGFGKTTVVTQWIAVHRPPGGVAWVSLDEGDNDTVRFWDYFIAAVRTLMPEAGGTASSMLHAPDSHATEAVLTALINDLAPVTNDLVVVLDDYHLITAEAVHTGVAFLVDRLPPRMHLVIATRTDPSLPLTRFRGRGTILEIRADDLRFTLEEATGLLQKMLGPALSSTEVQALNEHTEGWAVGLKMAALSLRGQRDVAAFIESFTGNQRYVMDYLLEEVLRHQPNEVRDFLLKTSVLEKLTAPLCDFISGHTGSQDMLMRLEQSNLFVVPLDGSRQWYRYHHLFAELLRHQLDSANGADEAARLHGRASRWYEDYDLPDDAIHHALVGRDWETAVRLVDTESEARLKRGEWGTLLNWFQAIPDSVLRTRPRLYSRYANVLLTQGHLDPAEAMLGHLEETYQTDARLQGEVALFQTILARMKGNIPRAAEMARRALALLPPDSLAMRARASFLLCTFDLMMLNIEEARQLASDALELARQAGELWTGASAASWVGAALFFQGKPLAAVEAARQGVELAGQSPAAAQALCNLAAFLYEYNELEEAAECALRAAELTERSGMAEGRAFASQYLAFERLARGDAAGALTWAEKADQAARHPTISPRGGRRIYESWRAVFAVLQDDLEGALHWGDRLSTYPDDLVQDLFFLYVPSRVLIAKGEKAAAAEKLQPLCEKAVRADANGLVAQLRMYQALAAPTHNEALPFLAEALKKGEAAGLIRTFVDEGKLLKPLLEKAWSQGVTPDYTRKLLDIIEKEERRRQAGSAVVATPASSGVLSERELEILRLIESGLSNRQIADRLIISLGTAKTHVHNVFEKLDVKTRTQAVSRSRELKLI